MTNIAQLRAKAENTEQQIGGCVRDIVAQLVLPGDQRSDPELRSDLARLIALRKTLKQIDRDFDRQKGDVDRAYPNRAAAAGVRRFFRELHQRVWVNRNIVQMIRTLIAAGPRPLYPDPTPAHGMLTQQTEVTDAVFIALQQYLQPETQAPEAAAHGCFPDISLLPSRFAEHAHAAYRVMLARQADRPIRFLDVGCGCGVKVLSASILFDQADGLEFDAGYAAVARDFLARSDAGNCNVIQGDALAFDGYADYDVIYFFRPMMTDDGLIALEDRILNHARPGTVLIAPYGMFHDRAPELNCAHVAGAVYLAGCDADEARAQREKAEYMGQNIVPPEHRRRVAKGVYAPVRDLCRATGFPVS